MNIKKVILISFAVSIAVVTIKSWIDDYRETERMIKNHEETKHLLNDMLRKEDPTTKFERKNLYHD